MREILFRGIAVCGPDHNKLIYGSAVFEDGQKPIIHQKNGKWEHVRPETIGQYTGLNDKNGRRIFEGDIIRFSRGEDITKCYPVKWSDRCAAYWVSDGYLSRFLQEFTEGVWKGCPCEIAGNVHDNPELLEGGCDG